jgi:hypothetical protein
MLMVSVLYSCSQRRYSNLTVFKHQPKMAKKERADRNIKKKTKNLIAEIIADKDYANEVKPNSENSSLLTQDIGQDISAGDIVKDALVSHSSQTNGLTAPESIKGGKRKTLTPKILAQAKKIRRAVREIKQAQKDQIISKQAPEDEIANLIYWILVVVLVLLLLVLLKTILGPLFEILVLAVLIALIGHLIGLW